MEGIVVNVSGRRQPLTRAGLKDWRGMEWSSARIVDTWLRTWSDTWSTWRRRDTSTPSDSWHTGHTSNSDLMISFRNITSGSLKIEPLGWRSGIIPLKRWKRKIPGRWHSMKRRKLRLGAKLCESVMAIYCIWNLNPLEYEERTEENVTQWFQVINIRSE